MSENALKKIKVLVVDDSAVMRKIISGALSKEPLIDVVGFAANGFQAIEKVRSLNPDVVTLDIEMPEMDGLSALKEIRKEYRRLPIIMFSTLTHKGAQAAVMALTAGASDYVGKPTTSAGSIEGAFKVLENELIPKIVGLAKRVGQTKKLSLADTGSTHLALTSPGQSKPLTSTGMSAKALSNLVVPNKPISAVCIGVSTGGPMALMQIFGRIQNPLPVPIFIVQHMPPTFTALLAARLSTAGATTVQEAQEGGVAEPGNAYIAPGGFHMTLGGIGARTTMHLNTDPPENSCRPAVDVLFRSAASRYGSGLLAIVLTGMGYDGLKGCKTIVLNGGQVIAQDEETSVIWGMPGAVAEQKLADVLLPIDRIADEVIFRTRKISRQV